TAIPIRNGDHIHIDIHLSPRPALHLLFRAPNEAFSISMPRLVRRTLDDLDYVFLQEMQPISPGLYEITGVPPGRYSVASRNFGQVDASDAPEVDLSTNGQELQAPPDGTGASVKLTVSLPGATALPDHLNILLRPKNQRGGIFRQLSP